MVETMRTGQVLKRHPISLSFTVAPWGGGGCGYLFIFASGKLHRADDAFYMPL